MPVSFEGFSFDVYPGVYEPAEDSFMLAEFSKNLTGDVLDVGTGSGMQAIVAKNANAIGVDVNEVAVRNAQHNAKLNKSNASFFVSDLFENVNGKFDCIVFNPPYLPTSEEEKVSGTYGLAWDGGDSGRTVIDSFLEEFDEYLEEKGKMLMLCSSLSEKGETKVTVGEKGFFYRELKRQPVGKFEELFVIEVRR